jgi:periplasmic divalent cation tolerance protein
MSDFIEIHWTSGSLDEARKVSRYLVQEGIVANAQIIPWFESIYLWNGALETTQESKVILKTLADRYEKVKEVVLQNSKYEVPEITYYKIEGANEAFQEWMSVATNPES